jgi:hypothetical protein
MTQHSKIASLGPIADAIRDFRPQPQLEWDDKAQCYVEVSATSERELGGVGPMTKIIQERIPKSKFSDFRFLPRKIISGGQTGADQGALAAARELGRETGGWMPEGFRTDEGPRPDLASEYDLSESNNRGYKDRTRTNVVISKGTLIFGNPDSPGCRLTREYVERYYKKLFLIGWTSGKADPPEYKQEDFRDWLHYYRIETLNVAGNRERTQPGIFEATKRFIMASLQAPPCP